MFMPQYSVTKTFLRTFKANFRAVLLKDDFQSMPSISWEKVTEKMSLEKGGGEGQ